MAKVFIDPGHGGKDGGTFGNGLIEKNVNLTVALKLMKLLQNNGFEVGCSRTTDTYLSLSKRSSLANEFGAEIFISVHHNAGGGDGAEVIHSIYAGKDDRLARLILKQFNKKQNSHGTGLMTKTSNVDPAKDYYSVISKTKAEAKVITEYAFLDSPDSDIINTIVKQAEEAYMIAFAVCEYAGVTFRDI